MIAIVRHRRWPLALALLALLWAALAPTLARAWVGDPRAGERVQICTSTGMAWVTLEAAGDAAPDDGSAAAMACDWCLLHGGPGLPPSAAGGGLPPAADPSAPVLDKVGAAVPPLAWWWPQPHAPPLLFV
ncbi:DUF2946 family protein [Tepidimonas sp.]|uniref:DUF2946 family protein n=1 Tax=Tepidimonas sp. TaxID=2002775 RepID=UPI00391995A5